MKKEYLYIGLALAALFYLGTRRTTTTGYPALYGQPGYPAVAPANTTAAIAASLASVANTWLTYAQTAGGGQQVQTQDYA